MLGIKSNISSRFLSIEVEVNRRRLYKGWKIYILYIWELV
jgi:hypothetical protein